MLMELVEASQDQGDERQDSAPTWSRDTDRSISGFGLGS